jgi:dTMP kinase
MPQAYQGKLITFEGVDGSGKTTQWQQAVAWLQQTYPTLEVVQTRNPGGTPLGQTLRRLLLTPTEAEIGTAPMAPTTELLLYMADRAQHVAEVVIPALQRGAIVLCDRFIDSSVAYQGGARGLSTQMIHQLNEIACQGVVPDCTLLFDASPEVLASRMVARGALDRLEQEGLSFQTKVREGFLAIQQAQPHRFRLIDASQPLAAVTQQVQDQLTTFFRVSLTQTSLSLL